MQLSLGNQDFEFVETPLTFGESRPTDLFARKNNKTLGATISHPEYLKLAARAFESHPPTGRSPLVRAVPTRCCRAFHQTANAGSIAHRDSRKGGNALFGNRGVTAPSWWVS